MNWFYSDSKEMVSINERCSRYLPKLQSWKFVTNWFFTSTAFFITVPHILMSRPNFRLLKMILSTTYFNTWILPHPSNFCQITSDFPYCFVLRTKILQVKLKDYPFISLRYWCVWALNSTRCTISIQSLDIVLSNASRYFGILR